MVPELRRRLAYATLAAAALAAAGCSGGEAPPVVKETEATKAAVDSAKTAWTPERQEAMRNALARARSGQEGSGVSAPTGGYVNPTGGGTANDDPGNTTNPATPPPSGVAQPAPSGQTRNSGSGASQRETQVASDGSGVVIGK